MSVLQGRGGVPHVFRDSISTTGRHHGFGWWSSWIRIRVTTAPCKVYFTKKDFDNDENYILVPIPAAETPHGEWDGPVETEGVWLKGSGGTSAIELVAIQRRG